MFCWELHVPLGITFSDSGKTFGEACRTENQAARRRAARTAGGADGGRRGRPAGRPATGGAAIVIAEVRAA